MARRIKTVGRRLAPGFGTVTAIFVVALSLSASAGTQWREATRWDAAVSGANDQLHGTQQQMAAQALYVATGKSAAGLDRRADRRHPVRHGARAGRRRGERRPHR